MDDSESQLDRFLRRQPVLGEGVYLARTAVVVGDVTLGDHASVWYQAVLRGDINYIKVGDYSNIQDGAVIHLADEYPCEIGDWVTVGHGAVVHACKVGDECLIGMNSTILDGAEVGAQSIVGANALVTQDTKIPEGSLVLGSPAKAVRALSSDERAGLRTWAVPLWRGLWTVGSCAKTRPSSIRSATTSPCSSSTRGSPCPSGSRGAAPPCSSPIPITRTTASAWATV